MLNNTVWPNVVETVRSYTVFGAVIYDSVIQVSIRSIKLTGCSSVFASSVVQAKMQWVQDPSERNVDNLNNVRCEASRCSRNKKEGIYES
jgi:hypothetical protein